MDARYYIYVDESGPFDEAIRPMVGCQRERPSIVGGVCGLLPTPGWESVHRKTVEDFNATSHISFSYPRHFHCAELLGNKIQAQGPVRRQDCEALAVAIWAGVSRHAAFLFASRNPEGRFEFSPQATYVLNLTTALRGAMNKLAEIEQGVDACEIMIAQRTIRETAEYDKREYEASLFGFVKEQLNVGDSRGVALAQRLSSSGMLRIVSGSGTKDAGLIAADFACGALRHDRDIGAKQFILEPEMARFGDYRQFYNQEVMRLIKTQQYAAATEFLRRYFPNRDGTPDLGPLLYALKQEADPAVLHRELNALLAEAECLVEKRTTMPGSLKAATAILESLDQLATSHLKGGSHAEVVRQWADLDVHALVLLSSCYNHTGSVGPQKNVEERLDCLLKTYRPKMSLSYLQRRELVLEAKIRNLNLLFNDYRFVEVLDVIEKDVEDRERVIPDSETDELLGKMLGSVGQACAFLARHDPSWSEMARGYFRRSLQHFQEGTVFHDMSVNFLSALAWQEGDLNLAVEEMNAHSAGVRLTGQEDLIERLSAVASVEGVSPFDVVNYLRIAASCADSGRSPSRESLEMTRLHWESRLINEHPHEQIAKWLGYLFFRSGFYERAEGIFERAVAISESLSFTVETIGLSIIGLRAINQFAGGNTTAYGQNVNRLRQSVLSIEKRSAPFAEYMARFGGGETLVEIVKKRDVHAAGTIARFLPFNYS